MNPHFWERMHYDKDVYNPLGWRLAYNGTGRNETVRTHAQEDAVLGELRALRQEVVALRQTAQPVRVTNFNEGDRRTAALAAETYNGAVRLGHTVRGQH